LEDLGVEGRITLERIFKKWDAEAWTGLFPLRLGVGGSGLLNKLMNLQVP
jgi:hypothetical protein